MATRRVFVISGARLTVHHRHGSKLVDPFSFDADEEGLARFARYLERFPNDVTCLLADVVEEEFRVETIPHVFGWDRRALHRTRAARAFRDTRYVQSMRLGREPGGRRDDRVLLSAITRPETLASWLGPMIRCSVPVAGIWSPAMLTAAILKVLGAEGEHVLVASLQSNGGLRQTCFERGRLQLSRLAAISDPATVGRYGESGILAEIERTRRYLGSLRMAADESRLEVYFLSHGEPLDEFRRELQHGGQLRSGYVAVDLADVARKLGMRGWDGESSADRLFVHLLARRPPPNHYATRKETRGLAMLRARSFLKAASTGLVTAGCLLGGTTFLEGVIANGHARALALQSMHYEHRYREARAALPPAPAEPVELQRVVSAVHTLRSTRADPVDLLGSISNALAGLPRVRIEGLSWRIADDAQAPVGDRAIHNDDDRAAPRLTGDESHGEGDETRSHPGLLFLLALVSARIEPFDGDYRAALETIRRFADTLAGLSGIEHVRVLSLPLDLSSGQTLTGEAETAIGAATFEIRVTRRIIDRDEASGA